MNILFTGASSFTGYWFVKELAAAGHQVTVTFQRSGAGYEGVRRQRVDLVKTLAEPVFECAFGDEKFLDLVGGSAWDLLCHHAADVTDYKSPDFDVAAALANNTREIDRILRGVQARGGNRILITGSIFEAHEGAGDNELQAFSPYGLSKTLTAEVFRYYAHRFGLKLGKFVIPNPFGPFEEPRFTAYLVRSWRDWKTPSVKTPHYVRDNIHVSLLALAYCRFATSLTPGPGIQKLNPSGYAESQGAFTRRFAAEMESRLGLPCPFHLEEWQEFPEPRKRTNTDKVAPAFPEWSEQEAWDQLAAYYREHLLGQTS